MLTAGVALIIALIGGGIVVSQQALSPQGSEPAENMQNAENTQEAEASPTPTPTPESSPVAKDDVSILVVNATSVAGKAGKTASVVEEAGYTDVDTGNAKGDYEKGTFIMVKDEAQKALIDQITKDTKLELEETEYQKAEDTQGKYDVIIVLAE